MRLQDNCIFAGGQGSSVVIPFKLKEKAALSDLKAWLRTRDFSFADFANAHPGAAAHIQFTVAETTSVPNPTLHHSAKSHASPRAWYDFPWQPSGCTALHEGCTAGVSLQRRATPHLPPSQARKTEVMLKDQSTKLLPTWNRQAGQCRPRR